MSLSVYLHSSLFFHFLEFFKLHVSSFLPTSFFITKKILDGNSRGLRTNPGSAIKASHFFALSLVL